MWLRLVIVFVTACSSKAENPRGSAQLDRPRDSVGSAASVHTRAPSSSTAQDLLFLPSSVASQLGSSELVVAVDFTKLDLDRILSQYPPLACLGDLIKSLGVGAITDVSPFMAFATNLTEPAARTCFDQIDREYGGKTLRTADGSYQIGTGDGAFFLSWRDGIVILREKLTQPLPSGPLLPELVALSRFVPRDAVFFFIAARGWPDRKIKNAVMWIAQTGDTADVVVRVEGQEPGRAGPWLREHVEGFKEVAVEKQLAFDDNWINLSVHEPVGTIEAQLPLSALAALNPFGP